MKKLSRTASDVIGFLVAVIAILIVDKFPNLTWRQEGLLFIVLVVVIISVIHAFRDDNKKK